MSQKDLFYLADISGFTHFVKETEISHSKHIIKELLELIINLAPKELKLSEIEGDATFMYAAKDTISLQQLFRSIERIYIEFHNHLKIYESKRICPCGACTTASSLDIKFVLHFGDLEFLEIHNIKKPYGKDTILVHRLMKNSINSDSYVLFSGINYDSITKIKSAYEFDISWKNGNDVYDKEDTIYCFSQLDYLNKKIRTYNKEALKPPKIKPIIDHIIIKTDMYKLYEIISNFNYRALWNTGAESFEFEKDKLNRSGEHHICVINNDRIDFETIHAEFGENKLVYGELTRNAPLVTEFYNYIVLEKKDDGTKLTVMIYLLSDSILKKLALPILKLGFRKNIKTLFKNLSELVQKDEVLIK